MAVTSLETVLFDESTNEAIRSALPEPAIAFFELVTHLGDGATLVALAVVLYWFGAESRRQRRALVIAIGVAALAVSAGLKGIFAHTRPTLPFAPADYGGYSFPSAHALGSAAVYGALAAFARTGTRFQRYAIAGTIVLLVAFSRVVIGVHYLGDVVVGVVLGFLLVALVVRSDDPSPEAIFLLSGVIAILAFVLGSTEYTTMTIGAAIGAAISWGYVSQQSWYPHGASILVLAYLALPVLIGMRAVSFVWQLHWITEIVGYALATAATLLVPAVAEQLNDWPPVLWLQDRLPFRGRTVDPDQLRKPSDD